LAFNSGREADRSPPSSAEVKEWAELYLHSPKTPSWRGALLGGAQGQLNFTLTPRSRVLQKVTVTQPVNKFLTLYRTRRFITVFTKAHHWADASNTHLPILLPLDPYTLRSSKWSLLICPLRHHK
jgi:hypothetical protein